MSLLEKVSKQVNYFETFPTDIFCICAIIFQSSVLPAQNSNRKKLYFRECKKKKDFVFFYENQPGSWLVANCERSENRGSGGGGSCQTGQKSGK